MWLQVVEFGWRALSIEMKKSCDWNLWSLDGKK